MKQTLINIARVAMGELRNILRDQGVILFVLIVPLAYPLLYAFIYNNETVHDVPVALVDLNDSPLSREFARKVDAASEVKVAARCTSMEEAQELNRRGEIYGILQIPADFSRTLARGGQATVGVYADMAGMLYYKALMLTATNVSLEMNKQIKLERYYTGATTRQEAVATQPIAYDYVALYNPQSGFAAFVLPAVIMLILQQTLMLGIGMTGGAIRERFGGRALPPLPEYGRATWVICGKTLVYFPLYLLMATYMFFVVTDMFTLPMLGSYVSYLALMIPYLLACIFMAMTFSAFIYRREDCILLFVFMSVPLLFISGISWPGTAVPEFWKYVGWLFPSTFACNGYVRVNSMGATPGQLRPELLALWLQTFCYFLLACAFYHRAARKRIPQAA